TIETIQKRATNKNPCVSQFILGNEKIILWDEEPEFNIRLGEISKGKITLSPSFAKEGKALPNQRRL
uniref:hypothetical protein n=1 Tax=Escherichia coli TaxID=562 RepID=UPI001BC8C666